MAKKAEVKQEASLKVTLVKSPAGCLEKHIRTVEALGLKKLRQSVVVKDNAAMRGMIHTVQHLVKVESL